ncbi:MAG: glycosyltransferase family 4 protein [Ignavibacteriaceae bacterium]
MTKNKKHILILTPGFPKDESDENCIPPLQIFLENLQSTFDNYKVSVITLHYPPSKLKYAWKNIEVYSCGGDDSTFIKKFKVWNDSFKYAHNIYREFSLFVIHSFWLGECAFLGNRLSKKYNVPHINTLMGQELNSRNRYLKFINLKRIKIVALTERQSDVYNNKTGRTVDKVIPWGMRNDEIIINKTREIDILGVGSLITGKNFELFIDIVNNIKSRFPKINAVIAGEGIQKDKLSNLISSNNLGNNIKLLGSLKRSEVLNLMSRSKIFLHTSSFESFGYVLAEALATGCYVVCSNTGFAHNTRKMFIANERDNFIRIVLDLLNTKPDFSPEIPFTLSYTTMLYNNLYNENI